MDNNRFWAAAPAQSESMICAVSAKRDGSSAQSIQIDVGTGKQVKSTNIPASVAKALQTSKFIVVDDHLVMLSSDTITVQPLCGEAQGESESFEMRKIKSSGKVPFQLMPWQRTPGVFAATNGATTAIFGVSEKGLKHLRTFEGVAVVGPVHSVHDDETGQPVAVAIVGDEGTKIQLLDPASGNVQPAINAEGFSAKDHGPARLLLVRELSSGEHHTVISAADHSLVGMQGSKVNWVREEALTGIKQAVFYSRAGMHKRRTVDEASVASLLPALTAQLSQLPVYLGDLAKKPAEIAAGLSDYVTGMGKEPRRQKPTLLPNAKAPANAEELRGFGANKLILCATRANKLFALEATTSEIVWQRYFTNGAELLGDMGAASHCAISNTTGAEENKCGLWMALLPTPAAFYSELIVMTPAPTDSSQTRQSVHWIDPLTGKDLHSEPAPGASGVISLMKLPRGTVKEQQKVQPFLLVDSKRNVHVVPTNKPEYEKILEGNAERLFHFEVNRRDQVVQGFAVGGSKSGSELVRLWNVELGSVGEHIVASTMPAHREWDHVPVHIKGDASILYKYINTNMIAVATEDIGKGNVTSLNLYVIDAVTGHVLHQSRIFGAAKPVHLAACDNWVLMHYWNEKRTRFELTVVEMFESKADDGPWNILFGGKQGQNFSVSAHHMDNPVPLQQTYIFPTGVTSMGVTATHKGITPRSVIMALTTDHLYSVSKDMLNPRRPYMTNGVLDKERSVPPQFAPTKEEPVPPYAPIIPLRHTDVLTYYNPMGKVTGIASSPTTLESTSLVFSYGLDLFFTPVQAAKAYDVLSPGFNYPLLYTSVGSVAAVLLVTTLWSSRRMLQDRWK
jgi:hypothetical protein